MYAPNHVYWEVYEKLPRLARFGPVPVNDLRRRFEDEYLPVLRFVFVSTDEIVDPQVLSITDADDVPLGQLAKLIAPCVVFSEDKHLRRPGLAPADWRLAAEFAVDLVESAGKEQATGMAAIAPSWAVVELIKLIGRKSGVSPWLLGGLAAGGAAVLLRRSERRQAVGKVGLSVIESLGRLLELAAAQEQRGLVGLREVILPAVPAPTMKQQIAVVLARQAEPVLAREVQDLVSVSFPSAPSDEAPTLSEVGSVLTTNPEFVESKDWRWQFGHLAGSMR